MATVPTSGEVVVPRLDVLVAATMEGAVRGGASRHVAAAVAAAALRVVVGERFSPPATVSESLVEDRLALIRPVLAAQMAAAERNGSDVHDAQGLVSGTTRLRCNVAKHAGFDLPVPVSELPVSQLKQL